MHELIRSILKESEEEIDDFFKPKNLKSREEKLGIERQEFLNKLNVGLSKIKSDYKNKKWDSKVEELFLKIFSQLHVDENYNEKWDGYFLKNDDNKKRALLTIQYNDFYISNKRIWHILENRFHGNYDETGSFLKNMWDKHSGLHEFTPLNAPTFFRLGLNENFSLKESTEEIDDFFKPKNLKSREEKYLKELEEKKKKIVEGLIQEKQWTLLLTDPKYIKILKNINRYKEVLQKGIEETKEHVEQLIQNRAWNVLLRNTLYVKTLKSINKYDEVLQNKLEEEKQQQIKNKAILNSPTSSDYNKIIAICSLYKSINERIRKLKELGYVIDICPIGRHEIGFKQIMKKTNQTRILVASYDYNKGYAYCVILSYK